MIVAAFAFPTPGSASSSDTTLSFAIASSAVARAMTSLILMSPDFSSARTSALVRRAAVARCSCVSALFWRQCWQWHATESSTAGASFCSAQRN